MGRTIPKIKEFPDDGRTWRVDWFGGVERNHQVPTEPKIQLIISPVIDGTTDYAASSAVNQEERRSIDLGVGQLPLVTIGSLWQNRRCLVEVAGKSKTFHNLHISPNTVRLVKSDVVVDGHPLIRRRFHQIGAGLGANCLAIEWHGDPYGIIIPVAEIIRFYYATSTDLAKAVFSGDFRHNLGSIVNPARCGFDKQERRCLLKLRKEFADADAWIIGRILNSHEAFEGATLVHDSMILEAVQNKRRVYPEAAFPFAGTTNLRARVKAMRTPDENGWRYIVFALEYCTGLFPFDSLTCDRDNSNLRPEIAPNLPDDQRLPAYSTQQSSAKDSDDRELQSGEEPSHHIQSVVITLPEERFGAVAGMTLEKPDKEMCNYFNASVVRPLGLPTDALGTGDGNYSESGVTPAHVETTSARPPALAASFKSFEAMIRFLNEKPRWHAQIRPFADTIAYIPLTKPRRARQWSYLDSERRQRRAVVIGDVTFASRTYSLIEFQWREGESFMLGIVSTHDGSRVSDYLMHLILLEFAKKEGRWDSVKSVLNGISVATLKHTRATVERFVAAIIYKISIEDGITRNALENIEL
ncbi:hypothetical protein R0381_000735 [Jeongeupia wiesaeckerbachi]|uniref:hypothetical protein n=1 Tax=Jeongeupia wiesaeckerbachi TaxID=3051218 RepID=UPI003D808CE2